MWEPTTIISQQLGQSLYSQTSPGISQISEPTLPNQISDDQAEKPKWKRGHPNKVKNATSMDDFIPDDA